MNVKMEDLRLDNFLGNITQGCGHYWCASLAPFKHNAPQTVMLDPTFQPPESQENMRTVVKQLVKEKIRTVYIKV
jgi:hypothetical protein